MCVRTFFEELLTFVVHISVHGCFAVRALKSKKGKTIKCMFYNVSKDEGQQFTKIIYHFYSIARRGNKTIIIFAYLFHYD